MYMTMMPKVTIAIPTYNRVAFLRQALDSALAQIYPNIEVVVSNNASTDDTVKLLASYGDERLKVIHQASNIGMMGNWDACLAAAAGDFFLLLSDDDVLETHAISELIAGFCNEKPSDIHASTSCSINEEIGMVWCAAGIINENNIVLRNSRKAPEMEDTFSAISGFFSNKRETFPCSILLRTSDIRQAGGYAASQLTLIADAYVWMACCLRRKHVRYVDKCLTNYRVHTDSGTTNVTIEEWLHNNTGLARFCVEYYQSLGEQQKAAIIKKLTNAYNVRSIIFLITNQIPKSGLSSFRSLLQYFVLCKKYRVNCCFDSFLMGAIRVTVNSGWLGRLRKN